MSLLQDCEKRIVFGTLGREQVISLVVERLSGMVGNGGIQIEDARFQDGNECLQIGYLPTDPGIHPTDTFQVNLKATRQICGRGKCLCLQKQMARRLVSEPDAPPCFACDGNPLVSSSRPASFSLVSW